MARLDHYAIRCSNKETAAKLYTEAFGYKIIDMFEIKFSEIDHANCLVLIPEEKGSLPISQQKRRLFGLDSIDFDDNIYHLPPEVFISDGTPGSVVGKWVAERGGIGGIHHLAYEVSDVEYEMEKWKEKGWATFTTEKPIKCPGLTQCFTNPHPVTGIIYEFIKRENQGFCKENVRELMLSTSGIK